MHSAFLYDAIRAGLDMAIVNAGQLTVYETIPKDLLELIEDVLLNRRPDATERLLTFANSMRQEGKAEAKEDAWREELVEERLKHALIKGIVDYIEQDVEEARQKYGRPLAVTRSMAPFVGPPGVRGAVRRRRTGLQGRRAMVLRLRNLRGRDGRSGALPRPGRSAGPTVRTCGPSDPAQPVRNRIREPASSRTHVGLRTRTSAGPGP